jgi:hypothetical protein
MTSTEMTAETANTVRTAGTAHWDVTAKSASTAAVPAVLNTSERRIDQSASRPPRVVPTRPPSPKTRRKNGMALGGRPVTCVTVGAM